MRCGIFVSTSISVDSEWLIKQTFVRMFVNPER